MLGFIISARLSASLVSCKAFAKLVFHRARPPILFRHGFAPIDIQRATKRSECIWKWRMKNQTKSKRNVQKGTHSVAKMQTKIKFKSHKHMEYCVLLCRFCIVFVPLRFASDAQSIVLIWKGNKTWIRFMLSAAFLLALIRFGCILSIANMHIKWNEISTHTHTRKTKKNIETVKLRTRGQYLR